MKTASATSVLGAIFCSWMLGVKIFSVELVLGHVPGRLAGSEVSTHLHHGDHALVGDGVGADGEVPRGVPTDNAVDGIPVW